jgi:hypothetical protein
VLAQDQVKYFSSKKFSHSFGDECRAGVKRKIEIAYAEKPGGKTKGAQAFVTNSYVRTKCAFA